MIGLIMKSEQFQLHAEVEERHWWFVARRKIMRQLIEQIAPPGAGKVVVDVGCGTGGNIASLRDGYECVGIDTSEEGIELAKERYKGEDGVKFLHGFAPADLGDMTQRTNVYLLMDVLEHVEDDRGLLGPVVESLPVGGHVLITVPANMRLWSQHDVSFGHYRRYDEKMIRKMWEGMPVSVQMLSYYNSRLFPVVRAVRALSNLRGRAWGKSGTDLSVPPNMVNRILTDIFAGEGEVLVNTLRGKRRRGYRRGVSMIALLRREQMAS